MSNKICKGCGVVLQSSDAAAIGYTPKMEADYCQRCFRIRHYDDVVISMKQGIDSDAVLQKINAMDALVVWVVDLFDFESNLLPGINRHLLGKDILMVATKRDLLPATLGNEKLSQFLLRRLKEEGILVQELWSAEIWLHMPGVRIMHPSMRCVRRLHITVRGVMLLSWAWRMPERALC